MDGPAGGDHPGRRLTAALDEIINLNARTYGGKARELYLGRDVCVIRVGYPKIIEGQFEAVPNRMSIEELWDMSDKENYNG